MNKKLIDDLRQLLWRLPITDLRACLIQGTKDDMIDQILRDSYQLSIPERVERIEHMREYIRNRGYE